MPLKKSDLYASIWASCDELRGGMDASQYKDYVLFMLFIKYISDKYANSKDFAPPVVIPKGASFADMIALKGKADIGDLLRKDVRTVNEYLVNIFEEGELRREATIRKFRIVRQEGSRELARDAEHYRLEAILAVGSRIRSKRGTQSRQPRTGWHGFERSRHGSGARRARRRASTSSGRRTMCGAGATCSQWWRWRRRPR
jgi:hypothetical protein